MPSYARFFKQQDSSDADLTIRIRRQQQGEEEDVPPSPKRARITASSDPRVLSEFPAHQIILRNSEYFEAQVLHWSTNVGSSTGSGQHGTAPYRPTLQLTIDAADQLPAAEAVIAAMYDVTSAISSLDQQQLVHAVMIADMLQAVEAAEQGVQLLKAAAALAPGLSAAALDVLASLAAWPSPLQQLLPSILEHTRDGEDIASQRERMLLAVFRDLQAVWEDEQAQQLLLQLPLPAMQQLLGSDQLQVPSEDTVLYTANMYMAAQPTAARRKAVKAVIAPLIRAPQLSLFAVSCSVLPLDSNNQLLGAYDTQLRQLLSLKMVAANSEEVSGALHRVKGTPTSWQLGPRQIQQSDGVQLTWRVPVVSVAEACKLSFQQQKPVQLRSPGSAPMAGLAWRLLIEASQEEGGTVVGVYAGPLKPPRGVFYNFDSTIESHGEVNRFASLRLANGTSRGWSDFFGLGPMTTGCGWDEAAWAAAGLPTSGDMLLELHVHKVW